METNKVIMDNGRFNSSEDSECFMYIKYISTLPSTSLATTFTGRYAVSRL